MRCSACSPEHDVSSSRGCTAGAEPVSPGIEKFGEEIFSLVPSNRPQKALLCLFIGVFFCFRPLWFSLTGQRWCLGCVGSLSIGTRVAQPLLFSRFLRSGFIQRTQIFSRHHMSNEVQLIPVTETPTVIIMGVCVASGP